MDWLWVALGLFLLLIAGDWLVKGAVNLALRLGIPALIVSLTIVAFGTSAPELLIAISAVLEGAPGLALGNVVGSNTANILLVLGVPALISTMCLKDCNAIKHYLMMLGATGIFIALASTGSFVWWSGLVLLAGLTFILGDSIRDALRHRAQEGVSTCADAEEDEVEGADPDMPYWKVFGFLALGLIGLPLGADLLIEGASEIAREFGISETVIGLTLVALGTSLPELATTVVAAIRRQADVAIGNVIGSNTFNLLAIIGITSLVGPIPVDPSVMALDIWVMAGASLVLAPFVFFRWPMGRLVGGLLTLSYLAYVFVILSQ